MPEKGRSRASVAGEFELTFLPQPFFILFRVYCFYYELFYSVTCRNDWCIKLTTLRFISSTRQSDHIMLFL